MNVVQHYLSAFDSLTCVVNCDIASLESVLNCAPVWGGDICIGFSHKSWFNTKISGLHYRMGENKWLGDCYNAWVVYIYGILKKNRLNYNTQQGQVFVIKVVLVVEISNLKWMLKTNFMFQFIWLYLISYWNYWMPIYINVMFWFTARTCYFFKNISIHRQNAQR